MDAVGRCMCEKNFDVVGYLVLSDAISILWNRCLILAPIQAIRLDAGHAPDGRNGSRFFLATLVIIAFMRARTTAGLTGPVGAGTAGSAAMRGASSGSMVVRCWLDIVVVDKFLGETEVAEGSYE